jgi:hypothetical protein
LLQVSVKFIAISMKGKNGKELELTIYKVQLPFHLLSQIPEQFGQGLFRNEYFELINKPNSKEEYQISKLNLNLKKVNKTAARFFYLNGNISVDTDEGLYHYINQKWSKIENISGLPLDTNFQVFTTFESKNNKDWVLIVNDAGYKDYGSFSFNKNSNKLVWENKFSKTIL